MAKRQTGERLDAQALIARWVAQREQVTLADDPAAARARVEQEMAELLARDDLSELEAVEVMLDAPNTLTGRGLRERASRRLSYGPVAMVGDDVVRALLEVAAKGSSAAVRVLRYTPDSGFRREFPIPWDVAERARGMHDLILLGRTQRQAHAESQAAREAEEREIAAAIDELRQRLIATGDWERLVAGSPVALAWLKSSDFDELAHQVRPKWLSGEIPRQLIRERIAAEAGR